MFCKLLVTYVRVSAGLHDLIAFANSICVRGLRPRATVAMADQLNYDVRNLYVPGASPLVGGEPVETDVLAATNWLIAKCRVNQCNFQVQWFDLTNGVFQTLGVSCPLLTPVRKTLWGLSSFRIISRCRQSSGRTINSLPPWL